MNATTVHTTPAGTDVWLEGDGVMVDNPEAPDHMRPTVVGRIVVTPKGRHGFKPAPGSMGLLGPGALRAVADLIEEATA